MQPWPDKGVDANLVALAQVYLFQHTPEESKEIYKDGLVRVMGNPRNCIGVYTCS